MWNEIVDENEREGVQYDKTINQCSIIRRISIVEHR